MQYDYLFDTPYTLEQPKYMYHFNSDTEFLGRMLEIQEGDIVLDVGTNTGALLCYIANKKGIPFGIDISEEVVEVARCNMVHNQIEASLFTCKLQEFKGYTFDHIVCNPPYFPTKKEELKNESEYLKRARHEEYLTLQDLFSYTYSLVKEKGSLQIVHRANRLDEIIDVAKKNGWYLRKFRYHLQSKKKPIPKSVYCYFEKEEGHVQQYVPSYLDDRSSVESRWYV